MTAHARQLAAAASVYDNAHEDDAQRDDDARAKRADAEGNAMPRESYSNIYREWAGVETRRYAFVPSNWQEGDFV